MKIRNVLSLFDGISCGQLALKKAGIEFDTYYASEVDKNPIYITQYNFPNTVQLGDVEKWKEWNIDWSKIDLLIGGSPCTNLSIAGNREGLEGEESRLFYAYVDILNHIKKFNPNVKFLLENVESMSDENKGIINSYMGCKPVMINSDLLSAQNRKRYYWVNWCLKKESLFGLPTCVIPQPKDKGILLKDILEHNNLSNYAGRLVGRLLDENGNRIDYSKFGKLKQVLEINTNPNKTNTLTTVQKDNIVVEKIDPTCLRYERTHEGKKLRKQYEKGEIKCGFNEHRILSPRNDGKTNTLTTVVKDNIICEPICSFVEKKYQEFAKDNGYIPKMFNPYNKAEITDKSPTIPTQASSQTKSCSVMMFEPLRLGHLPGLSNGQANRIYSVRGKSVCLSANGGGLGSKTYLYKINLPDGDYIIRKLTPVECERLQTVPDNYTKYGFNGKQKIKIPSSVRYKALGNGWTVDVITYIFNFLV